MNVNDLPPVTEANLTRPQVQQLLTDVEQCATNVEFVGGSKERLVRGRLPRFQLRYQWQGKRWIDTLERTDQGFRLVRIVH